MAQANWRRYYVPVFASGAFSRVSFGDRETLKLACKQQLRLTSDKLVGILAVKGKTVAAQRELWGRSF